MPFKVNITLDPERFEAAITDWNRNVRLENGAGAVDAAYALKDEIQNLLDIWHHPPGTPSPTAPFKGPPGYISGDLHNSVEVQIMPIAGFAKVGMASRYARIQEFGGFCGTHLSTYCPPRPYFRPTVLDFEQPEGHAQHIFVEHWRTAMLAAVKGIIF